MAKGKRRFRVLRWLVVVLAVTVIMLMGAVSYEGACPPATSIAAAAVAPTATGDSTSRIDSKIDRNLDRNLDRNIDSTMRAVRQRCYGGPELLRLEQVAVPVPSSSEVLVRVHVAATNALDWHYMRGKPYVMRLVSGLGTPSEPAFGVDFAGVVAAVGDGVRRFAVGDSVFGTRNGAFGQYVAVREAGAIAAMPHGASFESAAAMPVAGTTALQALRDHGHVAAGESVLVNGGSGGVGTYALQIAKASGARVTGVASTRNQELMRSLGADVTIDYTTTDFTQDSTRYDVIIDMVGNHAPSRLRRVLAPGGRVVLVGGPELDRWLGPLRTSVAFSVYDLFVSETFTGMLANNSATDLAFLADLMAAGKLRSAIDQRFTLAQTAEAIAYQERGRSRGKNVIRVR